MLGTMKAEARALVRVDLAGAEVLVKSVAPEGVKIKTGM